MPHETESFGERVERDANVSWIFISSVDMRVKKTESRSWLLDYMEQNRIETAEM
jgi:hypothetical protein